MLLDYIVINDNTDSVIEDTTRAYASIREIKQRPVDILVRKHNHFENRKNMPTIEQEFLKGGFFCMDDLLRRWIAMSKQDYE